MFKTAGIKQRGILYESESPKLSDCHLYFDFVKFHSLYVSKVSMNPKSYIDIEGQTNTIYRLK